MKAMMTRILVLLALALAGGEPGILSGQKTLDKARAMLAAPSAAERARGAMFVAKQKLTGAVPDLLRLIKAFPTEGRRAADAFAVEAAFDALIQMGVRVRAPMDGTDIARLSRRFLHPTVILLARTSGRHQHPLLQLVDRDSIGKDPVDIPAVSAVCTLLTALKTSGLAPYACKRLDRTLDVWITGAGGRRRLGDPTATAAKKPPPRTVPKGFPAVGFYRLVAVRGQKGNLVVRGNPNIAYQRVVASGGRAITFPAVKTRQPTLDHVAVTTLARLLEIRDRKLFAMLPREVTVRYRSEPHLDRVISKSGDNAGKGFDKLFDLLIQKRLLRADEAKALMPELKVVEHDTRERRE